MQKSYTPWRDSITPHVILIPSSSPSHVSHFPHYYCFLFFFFETVFRHKEIEEKQSYAAHQALSCLEEIGSIILEVQAVYESELMETLEDYEQPNYLKGLDDAVKGLNQA